jgi:hypothetical protein
LKNDAHYKTKIVFKMLNILALHLLNNAVHNIKVRYLLGRVCLSGLITKVKKLVNHLRVGWSRWLFLWTQTRRARGNRKPISSHLISAGCLRFPYYRATCGTLGLQLLSAREGSARSSLFNCNLPRWLGDSF